MKNNTKILDCTLRDGGYYNNWDFNKKTVEKYLVAVKKAKIDYIEIGFRNFAQNKFLGPYAYSTDKFIENLPNIDGLNLGVMSDASIFFNRGDSIENAVNELYKPKSESPISLVRIAAHYKDIARCEEIVKNLKGLGYIVGFNLMQTGGRKESEIEDAVKLIDSWKCVDVLYFADSLGNMNDKDVIKTIKSIKTYWKNALGIHTHNNKGQALSNSLTASINGVSWLDSTVLGMGRGAGNACTEDLLREINREKNLNYLPEEVYDLVLDDFSAMQKKYNWGHSLLYSLGADYEIHPTYIQEMLSEKRYSNKDILQMVKNMRDMPTRSFNKDTLDIIKNKTSNIDKGTWNANGWCKNREIVLIGNGPNSEAYRDGIVEYIKNYKPLVLSLNTQKNYSDDIIDGYIAANKSRIVIESKFYEKIKKPIYAPKFLFVDLPNYKDIANNIYDYGFSINKDNLIISESNCQIPADLAAIYAFSLVTIGMAKKISLVGFDGYEKNDLRQEEMQNAIAMYKKNEKAIDLVALTPTSYQVAKSSIYAPK
tara:strand:+ start:2223 stop:3839 length:1617 start_codon:yes stop_codon:yes gene_type:complete